MARIFLCMEREFPDPNPELSPEEVKDFMSTWFPELATADIRESTRDDDTIYELVKKVGTKGE